VLPGISAVACQLAPPAAGAFVPAVTTRVVQVTEPSTAMPTAACDPRPLNLRVGAAHRQLGTVVEVE
jgi:hypothetical protein